MKRPVIHTMVVIFRRRKKHKWPQNYLTAYKYNRLFGMSDRHTREKDGKKLRLMVKLRLSAVAFTKSVKHAAINCMFSALAFCNLVANLKPFQPQA